MVRDTLGEDAVIVATREENGGKAVRVTAAIEPTFELGHGGVAASADDWLQYDDEDEDGAIGEELTEVMLRHSVPEEIMDQILSCATVIGLEQPGIALIAALEHLFHFKPLPQKPQQKAMMMIGPPGSGKTLAVAKTAARGAMNDLKIGVVSCDTVRAGGIEQLQAFTKLLNINLQTAESAKDLRYIIADMDACDQIIIDTSGFNPFDKESVKDMAKLIGAADITPYAVLPGGNDAEEAAEMGRVFSTIGVKHLIPTRLDIARRLGSLLSVSHYGSLIFADASNTPKVADGLTAMTPKTLAKMLMPAGFRNAQAPPQKKTGTRQ